MKSMDKLKQINNENKYLKQIKTRQRSLEKENGVMNNYKENPIEYKLRTDFYNNQVKNKMKERDILHYNNQATKVLKMRMEQNKAKDVVHGKEFNKLIENQANTHLRNRTSQQGKYEVKRQAQDLLAFKERTLRVKKTVDDLITKHIELNGDKATDLEELKQMQVVIKKCLIDIEKAEQLQPTNPNSITREVSYKTNIILDWQIQNKKIAEIEVKLNDKEYK